MFNAAAVVGPAIAGVIYALFGPAWCFTLNGLSFIAVIDVFAADEATGCSETSDRVRLWQISRPGAELCKGRTRVVRTLILNMAVVSLFGISLVTLFPAWSVNVLGGDVRTNGCCSPAPWVGA